jgi:hypothetical protein
MQGHFCGLVVRVSGCRHTGHEFYSQGYQILSVAVDLERDPLSVVRINEEIFERKSGDSSLENLD